MRSRPLRFIHRLAPDPRPCLRSLRDLVLFKSERLFELLFYHRYSEHLPANKHSLLRHAPLLELTAHPAASCLGGPSWLHIAPRLSTLEVRRQHTCCVHLLLTCHSFDDALEHCGVTPKVSLLGMGKRTSCLTDVRGAASAVAYFQVEGSKTLFQAVPRPSGVSIRTQKEWEQIEACIASLENSKVPSLSHILSKHLCVNH